MSPRRPVGARGAMECRPVSTLRGPQPPDRRCRAVMTRNALAVRRIKRVYRANDVFAREVPRMLTMLRFFENAGCVVKCASRQGADFLTFFPLRPGRTSRLLSCPPSVGRPPPPCRPAKPANSCDILRNAVNPIMAVSHRLISTQTDRRHAAPLSAVVHLAGRISACRPHVDRSPKRLSTVCRTVAAWSERRCSTNRAHDHLMQRALRWRCRATQAALWT
jgi:hypothetical protein